MKFIESMKEGKILAHICCSYFSLGSMWNMRTEQFMGRSMYLLYLWKFFSFFPPASLLKVYSEVNIRIKNLKLISAFHTIIKFGRDLRLTSPAVSPNLPSPIIISLSTTSMRLEGWLCHLSGQLVSKPHQFNASQQVC